MKKQGYVYLVGAGPGDVRLITVKGLECLQKADVILYDRLVNPLLLEYARADAELVYCGKLPDRHILRQEKINELLVQYGNSGKVVVRLKGGDPSVFGRVAEEAEVLDQAEVKYEIVPGVTAAIGAATYAGVSVTHRDYSGSFAVITGHDKSENGKPSINWAALANGIDTIAFYMGIKNIAYISEQLLLHGLPKDTPVLVIQWGTVAKQRTLAGTIETIASQVVLAQIENPAVTLVGDVTKHRPKQSWFERQRLFGQQILYIKTTDDSNQIVSSLREEGAEVFEFPRWTTNPTQILNINVSIYDQIVFTSRNSVECFFRFLKNKQIDIRSIKARFYGTNRNVIEGLEQLACFAAHIDSFIKDGELLILGEENDHFEHKLKWGEHTYIKTHQDVAVLQSITTFQRLLEEGRINTVIFPNEKSISELTRLLAGCGITKDDFSRNRKVICFDDKVAALAMKFSFGVTDILSETNAEALIALLESDVLVES